MSVSCVTVRAAIYRRPIIQIIRSIRPIGIGIIKPIRLSLDCTLFHLSNWVIIIRKLGWIWPELLELLDFHCLMVILALINCDPYITVVNLNHHAWQGLTALQPQWRFLNFMVPTWKLVRLTSLSFFTWYQLRLNNLFDWVNFVLVVSCWI